MSQLEAQKQKIIQTLEQTPHIVFAMLYGSATELPHYRDLDVAIWVEPDAMSAREELAYAFDLADELVHRLHFPVDVRVINRAPLAFRYHVSKGQLLLAREEEQYAQFLERTWDEYLDFKPIAMQYLREMAA
ncbi:MAG: nucleotidyltransferase domain-containing protein [Caldilineaceae bacterium]